MNANQDLLSVTAFFSALIHLVVILGVSFKLPDIASLENTDNTLDVVLLNNSNNQKPEDAETVSVNDNLGGGDDKLDGATPLPYKPVDPSPIESIKQTAEQQNTTSLAPDSLITANVAEMSISDKPLVETKLKVAQESKGKDKITTKSAKRLERERRIAALNKRFEEYQKRPNKEYLSPTTMSNAAAGYLDQWRKRVEKLGNSSTQIKARTNGFVGTLILSVEVNRDGTIASVLVNKPSKHRVLNDAAMKIVRDASPYAAFDDKIDVNIDILVITRAFHFLDSNTVVTSDAASAR